VNEIFIMTNYLTLTHCHFATCYAT